MLGKICEKEMRQFLKNGLRKPHGQRLTMVNSVLSALPTTLKLPKKIIQYIDRARRHCLWRKSTDPSSSVQSMAAWDLVCKPKNKGGLGIVNLEFQNIALLAKNLDKFFNNRIYSGLIWFGINTTQIQTNLLMLTEKKAYFGGKIFSDLFLSSEPSHQLQ